MFAQSLLGFETVQQDIDAHQGGFVGINFVMPEDGYVSMRDYTLQMKMVEYLHSVYPKVHITLHAGELAPGLVPPEGLRFHIRQAVELGHAERIGHGVDVMYEDDRVRPAEGDGGQTRDGRRSISAPTRAFWVSRERSIRFRFIARPMCRWRFRPTMRA